MARINQGDTDIVLEGIKTPVVDTDAANKAYVDAHPGTVLTAGDGIDITNDVISVADDGITAAKIADNAVTSDAIAQHAVTTFEIAPEAIDEVRLDATNTPTAGQVLSAAGSDDQFTWVDQTTNPDYDNAAYGALGPLAFNAFSYVADLPVTTEGGIAIDAPGVGLTGNQLTFRTADVDLTRLQSLRIMQVGYGSPFTSGTYAVSEVTISGDNSDNIQVTLVDVPLGGDDVLATTPGVGDLMTIFVSTAPFMAPLDALSDVSETAPTNNQVLTYNTTDGLWEPADAQGGETENITASGGLQRVGDDISIADDGIVTAKIAPQAITSEEIADGTIVESDIAAGAISTTRLADSAVSSGKLADLSVATGKLQDVSVTRAKIVDAAVGASKLDVTGNGSIGQVLSSDGDGSFTWADDAQGITSVVGGAHIDVTTADGVATVDFNEIFDVWEKSDWVQINSGTPDFADDEFLFDPSDNTLTVPSLNGRAVLDILLSARSGMALHIRQENSTPTPSAFTSGFYQILDITAGTDPDRVVMELLPDVSDIFNEEGGGAYTYELTVLQFVTGGTLNNLTLDGLLDVDVSTAPTDGQVLAFDTDSGSYIPADNAGGAESLNQLSDVTLDTVANNQILRYNSTTSVFENVDLPEGGSLDLGDLDDVNTNGVADGFLIRYDGDNSNYRAHSVNDTLRLYGGLQVEGAGTSTLTPPVASGVDSIALGDNVIASGVASVAVGAATRASMERAVAIGRGANATGERSVSLGNDAIASATDAVSIGANSDATFANAVALGESAQAVHTDSVALGTGSAAQNAKEVRLGDSAAHVTINPDVAGNESEDNQLVSKRWVNNQLSDASRVVSSTANALENLAVVDAATPWDDYRIVPLDAESDPRLEVHMYEFDATQPQFIFYPGFMSSAAFGTGAGLSTGTIPDFFEEVTNIANDAEVTNADGEAVTSLGWKYLGHDTATVWQAVTHTFTFDFEWIYPAGNNAGAQNPPDVTSSVELVRLRPRADDTYSMVENAAVIASSPTQFHNAGTLNPGDTESFTGTYEFAATPETSGIGNVSNGEVFAYRLKIRYKGDGFDGDTNVRLAISESETTNFAPSLGIRHVARDYSLTLEDSGDLMWADHNVSLDTFLLLENTDDGPEIPAASLGLVAGSNITITGKTIAAAEGQVLMAGDGIDITNDMLSVDLSSSVNGSGLTFTNSELRVQEGESLTRTADGLEVNFRTETNNPLEISGTGDAAGLSLNIDEDGPLQKTTNGLDVILETQGGLSVGSLTSGIEVLLPANSGLQTDATGLSLNADLDELGDVSTTAPTDNQVLTWNNADSTWEPADAQGGGAETLAALTDVTITGTPTDGQILEYDSATEMWRNTSLSGNHSFTAGTGLAFNSDSTVLNLDANIFGFSRLAFDTGDVVHAVNSGATRFIAIGANGAIGGASSVAIGVSSQAISTNTIAIGAGARAEATVATAVGGGSRAMAVDSSAYGRSASATGARSTAVGDTSTASAPESTAVGSESSATGTGSTTLGSDTSTSGTNAVAVGFGATGTGDRAVAIGSEPDTSAAPLAIAIGERASVTATRGIAIGSSSNSASDTADRVQVTGLNGIAIGRAASCVAAQGMAIGDDTRALAADATAFGPSAQVTSTGIGSTAIGHNATATIANSTVLGSGTGHRVFAGSNELASAVNQSGDANSISCSINNDFFNGGGFNPNSTNSEILRYTQVNDLAIGRLDYKIALEESSNFQEGDRWAISSTSGPMRDAFGYAVGTYGIAIGTFVIAGSAVNSAAMGDMWLRTGSTTTNVSILFRVRSVIGTAPTRDSYISAQFNIAKF